MNKAQVDRAFARALFDSVPRPDRLGDAVREIARQSKNGRVQFAVSDGDDVALFELRHLRTTKRFVPHGQKGPSRRVGGVICIDPK